jgi:hypothetical protein
MAKVFSIFSHTMLPNRAWRQRLQTAESRDRLKYWALRIALALLLIAVFLLFNIQQHPALR